MNHDVESGRNVFSTDVFLTNLSTWHNRYNIVSNTDVRTLTYALMNFNENLMKIDGFIKHL